MTNFRSYAKGFMSYHYEKSFGRRIEVVDKQVNDLKKEKKQATNKMEGMEKRIVNLNKKIAKETDESKIELHKAEIQANEAGIVVQTNAILALQEQIDALITDMDVIKGELHKFQANIAEL